MKKPIVRRPAPSAQKPAIRKRPTSKVEQDAPEIDKSMKVRAGAKPKKPVGAGIRGTEGFAAAKQQRQKQQEEYERKKEKPYPFRITAADIRSGKSEVDLLYLDTDPYFVRLHTVKLGENRFDDEVCLVDKGVNCPLCRKTGKEGSYVMVLTALDKRPYRDRQGQLVQVSKKLVYVKGRNMEKFERQYKKFGTFRGLVCTHRRSTDKEASIGEDLEFKTKLVPEAALAKYRDLAKPADYDKAFVPLSVEEMREKYIDYVHESGYGDSRGSSVRSGGGKSDDDDDSPVNW
jgi:hypothetical protein